MQEKSPPRNRGSKKLKRMLHHNIERQAIEYIQDIISGGLTSEAEIKQALKDNLFLDDKEIKEVWQKWQSMKRANAPSAGER